MQELKEFKQDLITLGEVSTISDGEHKKLDYILGATIGQNENSSTHGLCSIQFSYQDVVYGVDLRSLFRAYTLGRISFHPNDIMPRRWGFLVGKKTSCKTWYGQQ